MQDIAAIRNYILFLKRECGLSLSLHTEHADNLIIPSELVTFNIHDNSYCICVKTCPEAHRHCVATQQKVLLKCAGGAFQGTCHAGVWEFVYPITDGANIIGFISVSGYQSANSEEYLDAISKKYPLNRERLEQAYRTLKQQAPAKSRIDLLIEPLRMMLELAYRKIAAVGEHEETFCEKVARYLSQNRLRNITSDDICRHFSCSRSYMSHQFNENMGMGIKQYINKLRIEDAKSLLQHSSLTITEIALSIGFSDSNYFTKIFRETTGISPREYRSQVRL